MLVQCTWGLLQTLVGLGFFLANRTCEHRFYRCCIDTRWNASGGLSLGMFIFTPKDGVPNGQLIRVHEYGHTIQSLVLGPLMLFVGIVSVAWGSIPYFARLRRGEGRALHGVLRGVLGKPVGRAGHERKGNLAVK